jgi:hypothetical protein
MAYARFQCAASFAVLVLATAASAQTPPPAPAGFAWKHIESLKAAFLMPDGWHFKERSAPADTRSFSITEENLDTSMEFETGLLIEVTRLEKDDAQEHGRGHRGAHPHPRD